MPGKRVIGAVERIDRRSLMYHILYRWVKFVFNQYYSKIEVTGLENIPKDAPVIFAPNHQNAVMDALVVLFSSPGDTVFLARADLFRKPLLARALNNLKILPVFRIRDGVGELGKNQEIFDITVGVLHRKHQLCLMPEGNHGSYRRLRALVKGIFRIAFKTQETHKDQPYVKIVPVGLDFQDYTKHHQTLLVNYGKPIEVSDYWKTFEENGPRGVNRIRDHLASELKELMIHIKTKDYYDTYMGLRTIYNPTMREKLGLSGKTLTDRFRADKTMISKLNQVLETDEPKIQTLHEKVTTYLAELRRMNIRDWVVAKKGYSLLQTLWRWLTLLITLPIFIYGLINNALVYFLPVLLVKNIKDRQFHSSVKAGAAMLFIFPFFYLLQTLLVGIFTGPWWIWVTYLILLYPTGKFALHWYFRIKKTLRAGWFGHRYRRNKKDATQMVKQRAEIIKSMNDML